MNVHPSLRRAIHLVACGLVGAAVACGHDHAPEADAEAYESWAVTAWGELYEVFPEVDPLVAGAEASAHTHVTILEGFAAMQAGTVSIVLRGERGEQVFTAREPVRPGIFNVAVVPEAAGDYELLFRIAGAAGEETIPGGRVNVGTAAAPGGLVAGPANAPPVGGGELLPFLKEQQWRTAFATTTVQTGQFARSVDGVALVRPVAGGEVRLSAPLGAALDREPWPHVGQAVERGQVLFRLRPSVAGERSLAVLEAEVAEVGEELSLARDRLVRLDELLAVEATSRRERDEARGRVVGLEARLGAAERDLRAARSARSGTSAGETIAVAAPFAGSIAEVMVSPGETVAQAAQLARLVRTDPCWLEVALAPQDAARLAGGLAGVRLTPPGGDPRTLVRDEVRLVASGPEVSPATGKVPVLVEILGTRGLVLGSRLDAVLELAETVAGIVVPTTALVDDSGVDVVYLQAEGEAFVRQEVTILERRGDAALVAGLAAGQRLVTRGGGAIRRTSLLATGEPEGHVH